MAGQGKSICHSKNRNNLAESIEMGFLLHFGCSYILFFRCRKAIHLFPILSKMNIDVFLRKVALFLIIPVLGGVILYCLLTYKNNSVIKKYKLDQQITTLFIGDSHIQQCINDARIPNSVNFSMHSESYYFSYYKIKMLLKNNFQVKKVYLGFSYHNLSSYNDAFIFGTYSKDIAPRYFFIMPNAEKWKLIESNADNFTLFAKNILVNGMKNSFLGNYHNDFNRVTANTVSMDKRILFQFYHENKLDSFSSFNLHYLGEIVKLCEKEKIQLIFLSTPLHIYYRNHIPLAYIKKYDEVLKTYKSPVVNYSGIAFSDSCFVPDGDHVSVKGSTIASTSISY